jgi:exo-poly-alpha-galacturonosidase
MPNRLLPLLLLAALQAGCALQTASISQFGAVGDGKTVNTKAIQTAIDHLSTTGGGVLVVPKGTFLSGALFFKQGVDLRVEEGGKLKGTTVQADYPLVHTRWEGQEGMHTCAFLNFDGMTNVHVDGTGTIDGSGDAWLRAGRGGFGRGGGGFGGRGGFGRGGTSRPTTRRFGTTFPAFQQVGRPRLVCFSNCDDVHISDVHLLNQAIWCLHILYSKNVEVDNVHILATVYIPSSDGIDVDSSRDVTIDHCDIACYDDDISIKSGKDDDGRRVNRPSENITIKNCNIGIGEGIAMGSEVTGSIRHVLVENCTFNRSNTGARIKSQPSRGGVIEDLVFRDIKLINVRRAYEFLLDWNLRLERAEPTNAKTIVRDVHLINYTGTATSGGLIEGLKDGPIRDVHWQNCNVTAQTGMNIVNSVDLDTSGLNLKVARGKPIIMGPPDYGY